MASVSSRVGEGKLTAPVAPSSGVAPAAGGIITSVGRMARSLRWTVRPLAAYAASRLVVLIAIGVTSTLFPGHSLWWYLQQWDGFWYLNVVRDGYPSVLPVHSGLVAQNTTAFFPLYPMLIRLVVGTGVSDVGAGLLISGIFGVASVLLLWKLLARLWGDEAADRGAALFCFLPGALIFSLLYAEPLMMTCSFGCLLLLLDRRWVAAGVLAALATATRPNALALVAACGWAALVAVVRRREWRSLLAPLLAPVGAIAYLWFLRARTGRADAFFVTQRDGWGQTSDLTLTWDRMGGFFADPWSVAQHSVLALSVTFTIVLLVLFLKGRPPGPVLVYSAVIIALANFHSMYGVWPRFLLTAGPLSVVPARYLRGASSSIVVGLFATLLGAFTVLIMSTVILPP